MRFDDMIATVLERPSVRPDQRAAQWRQLVDLLAQGRHDGAGGEAERAYAFLRNHRSEVELSVRQQTAAALAGLRIDPALLTFFGEDHPVVAGALLRGARLTGAEWIELLPSLTPTGRAILRHRRDLPSEVAQALASFGPSDFVLGTSVEAPEYEKAPPAAVAARSGAAFVSVDPAPSQIRELVERIVAFQKHREEEEGRSAADRADEFRWETGPEGIILWVDGAPRGPLVGQSIAAIADHGQYGVDGQAAGAYHKRSPFRDARFTVVGDGPAAGSWRISGVPYFDMNRGNFLGYRGTARRPRFDEVAPQPRVEAAEGLFGTDLAPDSLRQLIHELRTPLNAIIGFAEMIEGQYMGPAGSGYRGRAGEIVGQARRLLSAVDNLDTAARIETSRFDLVQSEVDAVALLVRLHDAYEQEAGGRGARFAVQIKERLPTAAVEPPAAERMLSRLLAATIGLADKGETINAAMRLVHPGGAPMLCLALDRPRAIAGLDDAFLLHPGYSPEGDWPGAPALGLGFALRLVRKLAEAAGGTLEITEARFVLSLPVAD
ncbi:MAG TPA: HAMP domain-containing sensor histidine kinase, partial [Allosphingosinicella sp.]|nr:HAMP domain-containing sensor histidine kinase [Allosphingosinicella sp.]